MKVLILNTPNRGYATDFPPVGALSVLNYARKHGPEGAEYSFYNVDFLRPTLEQAIEYIVAYKPDVVGISAVISTSYLFTKTIALALHERLPDCLLVIGGNLASAAELLLRKAKVDICVPGEGEMVFRDLLHHLQDHPGNRDFSAIPGLVYLDAAGKLVNTGLEKPLSADQIWDFDWDDLDRSGLTGHYVRPVFNDDGIPRHPWRLDRRSFEPHRKNKNLAVLNCVKGCVARCTFCHRNQKGIRHIPVELVMKRLDELIERYNVGFVYMGAETFGADKRWLTTFLEEIKKRDVLWGAGGVRANTFDFGWVEKVKEAGCVNLSYGNETGSERMLAIMEKKVTKEENYQAMENVIRAGFPTGMQFVLGMPGESEETVRETIEFIKFGTTLSEEENPDRFAIGYAQALPGTPLYEYARLHGYIKPGIDGEDEYLLRMSNRDASDPDVAINFTHVPRLRWLAWRHLISIEVYHNYLKKFGREHYYKIIARDLAYLGGFHGDAPEVADAILAPYLETLREGKSPPLSVLFKLLTSDRPGLSMTFYPTVFYPLRHMVSLIELVRSSMLYGWKRGVFLAWDWLTFRLSQPFRQPKFKYEYKSLRKIVQDLGYMPEDPEGMFPLREGR
ncbi:hypothetical protein JCM17960_13920 [Magnetospira thiophila]